MQSDRKHWNVPILEIGSRGIKPTYADHSVISMIEIEEISAALQESYPHFQAVLTPERNFLHYLISGIVSNVAVSDKEYLFQQVGRLHKTHVSEIGSNQSQTIATSADEVRALASAFYRHKQDSKSPMPLVADEWQQFFEKTYQTLQRSVSHADYLPGLHDARLDTQEKVFCRICENQCTRLEYEKIGKSLANKVIEEELNEGRLKRLPQHDKSKTFNLVLAGVIAAGKSCFLSRLKMDGKIFREDSSYIDIDEWKDLPLLVDRSLDDPSSPPSWNKRVHDECHMVRRKIFDELEAKAKTEESPNVLLTTSLLSERVLSWLIHDNPKTNLYLFYCEPDQALQHSMERHEGGGRRMSVEVILSSVKNLATSTANILSQAADGNHNLFIQVEDTTNVKREGSATILKMDAENGLYVYDLDAFFKLQQGIFINPKATKPEDTYKPFEESQLTARVCAILRPHRVTFVDKDGSPYATKKADTDEITLVTGKDISTAANLERIDPTFIARNTTVKEVGG